jgi:hypothetical protein
MGNHRWLFPVVLAALALLSAGAGAQDDDDDDDDGDDESKNGRAVTCSTGLGDVQVRGDLRIATPCQLSGTDVRGDVILFEGGSLTARNARIRGTLEANRADFVDLERSRVDGAVRLQGLVGDESRIERSDLRGTTAITANRSRFAILNNEFRRNVRVVANTGGVSISGNFVDRDLECLQNQPPPVGVANRVDGEARGQCEDLRAESATEPPPASPPPPTTTPPPPRTPTPPSTPTSPPPRTPTPPSTPMPPPTAAEPPAPSPPPAPAPEPPPPRTPAPPPTSSPPATAPPAASPPAATPAPPSAAPPPSPPTEPDPSIADEGGAGAMGLGVALLLPLLAWRRFTRRRRAVGRDLPP